MIRIGDQVSLTNSYEKTYQGPVSAISHLNTSSNHEYIVVVLGPKFGRVLL